MASEYVARRLAQINAEHMAKDASRPPPKPPLPRLVPSPAKPFVPPIAFKPAPRKQWPKKTVLRPKYHVLLGEFGREISRNLDGWARVKVPTHILPLDMLRALPTGEPPDSGGVYFLWRGPQLLYVGLTRYLGERLFQHRMARDGMRAGKPIPFTRYTFKEMPDSEIEGFESDYILSYMPPYNDKIPNCWRNGDPL